MKKTRVAIIGTGNIGTDLLMKVARSKIIECAIFTGRNPGSEGIKRAKALGVETSCDSVEAIKNKPDCCDIIFDATSAVSHFYHAGILEHLGKFTIDLTPSQIGKICIPVINIDECLGKKNISLITCGGQAAIPIAYAIKQVHPETEYFEIVASISSRSAGAGTRENIDEFTRATRDALAEFTGVPKTKAIIILNPAEPPVLMHNTIYAKIKKPKISELSESIKAMVKKIQAYVPGYKIAVGPLAEDSRVTTMVQVTGCGDFLPKYSGNLDIMTCAAINVAEEYAKRRV